MNTHVITVEQVATKSRVSELRGNDFYIFWLQGDLDNKNRNELYCYCPRLNLSKKITSSSEYNIKSSINEYGGGSYWLDNNSLYFFNKDNSTVCYIDLHLISKEYFQTDVHSSLKITELGNTRPTNNSTNATSLIDNTSSYKLLDVIYNYADGMVLDSGFVTVREVIKTGSETKQELILYNNEKKTISVLDDDYDFYSFPRFNKNNNKLIWLSWNHPNMPWDQNILCCANLDLESDNLVDKTELIKINNTSMYQPEWYDDENIFIVSDCNQTSCSSDKKPCWNLYLYNITNDIYKAVLTGAFEFGLPLWQLASNTYYYNKQSGNTIHLCFYLLKNAKSYFGHAVFNLIKDKDNKVLSISKKNLSVLDSKIVHIQDNIHCIDSNIYCLASTNYSDLSITKFDVTNNASCNLFGYVLNGEEDTQVDKNKPGKPNGYNQSKIKNNISEIVQRISIAEDIVFENDFGDTVYGFLYKALPVNNNQNSACLPPLIVMCHGGPTGTTNAGYNNKIQFWTSRGYAVVDVNYSGSTTYGREYRDRLKHNWGVKDVADCAAAAKYLIDKDLVDKNKIFIRGSSAGGLVVLTALYKYDVFTAGVALYPVSNLVSFNDETHNFEKFYNNYLIGDFPTCKQEYIKRSPINFADKITKPVLLMHGDTDNVIPVQHTRDLFEKLKNNHTLNKYIEISGEGHGFRTIDALKKSFNAELEFYELLDSLN